MTATMTAPRAAPLLDTALLPVQAELEAVTQRMLQKLEDPVAKSVTYLITAGGKRLRPALVLLAGHAGPAPDRAALIEAAAAVELIHTATLIHDDIVDRSPRRRSQPTFHYRWGTERAVLMGDYLYATAFTMIAGLNTPEVMRVMARVCQDLSHIFIASARSLGVPARYVGGYFFRNDGITDQDAGHAWAEAFVPDLGWVAFDAANGISATDAHVRVAVGLDYLGAAPVRGMRYGGSGETLTVNVHVEKAARQAQNQ